MSALATRTTLRCDGLHKNFGGVQAVDNVGFSVDRQRVLGILGPNGSGKTTLLNLISGVTATDAGHIWLDDRDVTRTSPVKHAELGLARTFQNLRLFRNLTVLENLLIGGHVADRGGARNAIMHPFAAEAALRDRARGLLGELGLERDASRPAGALAYGLQRRVEIGRSLMSRPSVLLLDEPVAGMNDVEATSVLDFLQSLRERDIAQVVVEHNVAFVTQLVDEVLVMDAGKVLMTGKPADVVRDERVIKAYLG